MKFSILVPAYNEEQSIASCLRSLTSIEYDEKEIIVVDDASMDQTVRIIETFLDKDVILVKRERNGGRAAALNSGLRKATGDVVVTTDADTIVPCDWLQKFKLYFEQRDVVAVGGAYQAYNKDKPLAYATSILDQVFNGVFKKSFVPNKLSGVNSAIRRNALLSLDGFNENSWWSEDSDLGWKLNRIGKVDYAPDNIVSTTYPDTWQNIWKRKFYWGYAMGLKFREQMPLSIRLWLRPLIFTALFISLFAFLVTLPYGIKMSFTPGIIFLFLLSSMTIVYVPLGVLVMIKDKSLTPVRILLLLAILPIVREFAYVYGMCIGFYKGRVGSIMPTWKTKINRRENIWQKK